MVLRPFARHTKATGEERTNPRRAEQAGHLISNDSPPADRPAGGVGADGATLHQTASVALPDGAGPGWYPDEADPRLMRYWDGFHLTGQFMHVHSRAGEAEAGAPAPAPTGADVASIESFSRVTEQQSVGPRAADSPPARPPDPVQRAGASRTADLSATDLLAPFRSQPVAPRDPKPAAGPGSLRAVPSVPAASTPVVAAEVPPVKPAVVVEVPPVKPAVAAAPAATPAHTAASQDADTTSMEPTGGRDETWTALRRFGEPRPGPKSDTNGGANAEPKAEQKAGPTVGSGATVERRPEAKVEADAGDAADSAVEASAGAAVEAGAGEDRMSSNPEGESTMDARAPGDAVVVTPFTGDDRLNRNDLRRPGGMPPATGSRSARSLGAGDEAANWAEQTEKAVTKAKDLGTPDAWQEAARVAAVVAEVAQTMQAAADATQAAGQTAKEAEDAAERARAAARQASEARQSAERTAKAAREAAEAAKVAERAAADAKEAAALSAQEAPKLAEAARVAAQAAAGAGRKAQGLDEIVVKASTANTPEAWSEALKLSAGPGATPGRG